MQSVAVDRKEGSITLGAKARLPQHVVYRVFVKETVALNLKTGKYHGLNPIAGRMLDVLGRADSIGAAIDKLAAEYDVAAEQIAADVLDLCEHLVERDLIEISNA
jgi:hypothetical protein